MGHTYELLAVLLTVGVLSLNGAHSLFCSDGTATGNGVEISEEECVNHTVMYIWTSSHNFEVEIEINCDNGTHNTGSIESYELTLSSRGDVMTQIFPELEGNVQCMIRGCYEDTDEFITLSIASVTVDCVSPTDVPPSPTPLSSPTPSSSLAFGSSSDSVADTSEAAEPSPTLSPSLMMQPTGNSSPSSLVLRYIVAPVLGLLVLVFIIIIIVTTILVIRRAQRRRGDWV